MTHASDMTLSDQLLRLEPVKTWSLIATVFGDMDGDCISGKDLKALLAQLGIRPEAIRVALHRLKKDGWILSEKSGREVIYSLSPHGQVETRAAREDVYRADVKYPEGWRVALLPPDGRVADTQHMAVPLDRGLYVLPSSHESVADALMMVPQGPVPVWVEDRLVPEHMRITARRLVDLGADFQRRLPSTDEAIHLRLIFLHLWRKMALRPGTWAHIGLLPSGVMAECHAAMAQVFAQTQPTPATML